MRRFFGLTGRDTAGEQVEGQLDGQNHLSARRTARRPLVLLLAPFLLLLAVQKSPAPVTVGPILYTAVPTNGLAPLTVQFNAASTNTTGSLEVTVTNWVWNFNDGTPLVTGQNPVHTFTGGGVFTVSETNYCSNFFLGGGIIVLGSISTSTVTPSVITTTSVVATVTGYVFLSTEPAGFYLTNGVALVSLPGIYPNGPTFPTGPINGYPSAPVRFVPVTIISDGSGFWSFKAQISLPNVLYPNGTYAQPTWPSDPFFPISPIYQADPVIIMMEYNDGQGHTGIILGEAVYEPSA